MNIENVDEFKDAVWHVVDYLFRDEEKDYEERGRPRNHIFKSVHVLNDWLNKQTIPPGAAIRAASRWAKIMKDFDATPPMRLRAQRRSRRKAAD